MAAKARLTAASEAMRDPGLEVTEVAEQPTLVQRIVLWVLNALLFFVVALYPAYQMAFDFASDSTVLYTFLAAVIVMVGLYAAASKMFFKGA